MFEILLSFQTTDRLKWRYDTADMNMVHMGGAISTYDGNLVVSGGYDRVEDRYKLTGRMEVYRVEGNRWEAVGSEIPQPTFWHQTSSVYRFVINSFSKVSNKL